MKNRIFVSALVSVVLVLVMVLIYGCGASTSGGGGTSTTHGTYSYFGTQSGGDVWKWHIGSGTFTGTNETVPFTIAGTWVTLPSGYSKATVTASVGGPTVGSQAYFLEVWNTALIVKPTTSEDGAADKVIVCGALSSTPPPPGLYPWITIPREDWGTGSKEVFGITTVEAGATYTFEVTCYDMNGAAIPGYGGVESGFTFSGGVLSNTGVSSLEIAITESGIFIGDQGPGMGGFAGSIKPTSDYRAEAAGHNYRGVLFKYYPGGTATGETEPIGAEPHGTNRLFGYSFTDVDAGTRYTGGGVTIEMTSFNASTGIVSAEADDNGTPTAMKMLINKIDGKFVVFGLQETDGLPLNFIVVQID
jgi:hypothetical protein